ncbi:MAG: carbon-nitrogen hydrolase family protein [Actinomycetota bacterium]|nr:carbon-nitrogen hydrolase family protein [Actinomycetota bacterium]MDQ5808746.1 carbon-nitrogen hydrolase family protein [Actinomycetota bacterium]
MRVAAVQMNSTDDLERNLETADRLTRAAARDGARLIVLPEKWPALGTNEVVASGAQDEDGPAIAWAKRTARELKVDLIAGSVALRHGERLRNTAVHAGPDGEVHATYTKIHLFDVEVDGRTYRESEHEDAGDEVVTTTAQDGTEVGLSVCYDLRFPTLYEELGHRGAKVIVVPSAFTLKTTRDHWDVLVRARAIEQQAFVIAANQVGTHPGGMQSGGRSMIVDPWGVVLAQAPDAEAHVVADLDLEAQRRIRAELPALRHRRVRV